MKRTFRAVLINFALLTASGLIVLVIGELIAHKYVGTQLKEYIRNQPDMLRPCANSEMGYLMLPNFRDSCYETNSQGFRDREHLLAKSSSTKRIIIIGNSVGFGLGICDMDSLFSRLLEEMLNQGNRGGAFNYEVLNLCIPGYNSIMQLALLKEFGAKYEPNLVLTAFCRNDYEVEPKLINQGGSFIWRAATMNRTGPFWQRSYLLTIVKGSLRSFMVNQLNYQPEEYQNRIQSRAWQAMLHTLKETRNYCENIGAEYSVLIFPAGNQFGKNAMKPIFQSSLTSFFDNTGVDYLDLYPTFAKSGLEPRDLFIWGYDDEHPTKLGQRLASASIFAYLKDHSYLLR